MAWARNLALERQEPRLQPLPDEGRDSRPESPGKRLASYAQLGGDGRQRVAVRCTVDDEAQSGEIVAVGCVDCRGDGLRNEVPQAEAPAPDLPWIALVSDSPDAC